MKKIALTVILFGSLFPLPSLANNNIEMVKWYLKAIEQRNNLVKFNLNSYYE